MSRKQNIVAIGAVSIGCTIDANSVWPQPIRVSSGSTMREKRMVLRHDLYIGSCAGKCLVYIGVKRGAYSADHESRYPAQGIFYNSVPATLPAVGAPMASSQFGGKILSTLWPLQLASGKKVEIDLIGYAASRNIPSWCESALANKGYKSHWITGDMPYLDVYMKLKWEQSGHSRSVIISNEQRPHFSNLLSFGKSHRPIIFNATGNPDIDCEVIDECIRKELPAMVVLAGDSCSPLTEDDRGRLTAAYTKLLHQAGSLSLVVNREGLERIFPGQYRQSSSGALHGAAVLSLLKKAHDLKAVNSFRRLYFVSPTRWIAIDEKGQASRKKISGREYGPEYADIVSGLVFAFELESIGAGKYRPVNQVLDSAAAILESGKLGS